MQWVTRERPKIDRIASVIALALLATALHSHMIDDSPHVFFMHFWANHDAQKLAKGLRAALDLANVKRST
jgi:hypothetical protein